MPFDGAGAEKQPRTDVGIRESVACHLGDLPLLRGQLVPGLHGAPPGTLAGGGELLARAFGERLHADCAERVVRRAELRAGVDPPALAPEPLAVEQLRSGKLGAKPAAAEMVDRDAVEL